MVEPFCEVAERGPLSVYVGIPLSESTCLSKRMRTGHLGVR